MRWQFSCKKPAAMVDEVSSENISRALFLDFENLNRRAFCFSSDSPDAFPDDRVLEEVEELACKVDANVAIPLVRALLLDLGRNLLCAQLFDLEQLAISRAKANDNFWYTVVWSATWPV
jgi:hypothetical protein